jgi:hypothetical protein
MQPHHLCRSSRIDPCHVCTLQSALDPADDRKRLLEIRPHRKMCFERLYTLCGIPCLPVCTAQDGLMMPDKYKCFLLYTIPYAT